MNACGAKTRNGSPCKRAPTTNGRCNLHGGKALQGTEHPNFTHGRYSAYLPQAIAEKVASFEADDALDLQPELNVQRALFADYISRFKAGYVLSAEDISLMMGWSTEITRTGERINKMRNETALTAAEVKFLAARIADVVAKYISEDEVRRAFVRELLGASGVIHRVTDGT